jgi:phasin family protein
MAKKPEGQPIMDMLSALGTDLRLPKVDVDMIIDHHRKNLEALQKSASVTASGASTLLARQREVMQEAMREMTEMAQGFKATSPQEAMAKQTEFMRRSFEAAVKNASEMAQIVQKSGTESVDILKQRIRESMEEIRGSYDKK